MKEDQITKRIKELQKDNRFTFKLTEDIIDSIYRIALDDVAKRLIQINGKDPNESHKSKDTIVGSSREMNERYGSKHSYDDYDKKQTLIFKAKREAYNDILDHIEKKNNLMDVYVYVKEQAKKTKYDEIKIV